MGLTSLAAVHQSSSPLAKDLRADVHQFGPAMRQCEVLIVPLEHSAQPRLLIAYLPMHMLTKPLLGSVEEFSTALLTGPTNDREPPTAINSADMLEAEKDESVRPFALGR
jgi:hypothetical protein